uniref:Prenyltransferase alpha-alpha toroid domain-containing protein n=1 Tax=Alexandrium monilatum TaxID=311494 RepID=A0A7S4Q3J6_9DINO
MSADDFALERHGDYFKMHMRVLHWHYKTMDTNRLTLLYFCVSGLDLLGMLDGVDRAEVVDFIYSLQSPHPDLGGFYGYPRVCGFASEEQDRRNNQPHVANTYVALVMLVILGDNLGGVRRDAIRHSLRKWQLPDGSFCCVHGISSLDSESDMRFVYCACAICHLLDLWDAVDVDAAHGFVLASRSYDGAFGMGPGTESHGGCTYCALAALAMMGRLRGLPGRERLVDWCAKRQHLGFQGRVEKAMDSCYSFWVGASLQLLGSGELLEAGSCARFLRECEAVGTGGFRKFPESRAPDLLHSYFSVCGLSLCGHLKPLNALLNMSEEAYGARTGGFSTALGDGQGSGLGSGSSRPAHAARVANGGTSPQRGWCNPALLAAAAAVLLPVLLKWWR